jgi:MFS family permease
VPRLAELAQRVLPPTPLARRLSAQSILYAFGQGTFLTGSAVFFTQVVGLSAAQVGLGLTLAGVVTFVFAIPLGRVADRIGTKRIWALGSAADALLYATWPLIHGFTGYLVVITLIELAGTAAWTGAGAYQIAVLPKEERVRSQAFMRAALNIGFTLGALVGGVALAFDSDAVVRAVPVLTAVVLAANALWVTALPDVLPDVASAEVVTPLEDVTTQKRSALRNRGFLALNTFDGVLGTNQVLLNVLIPLWLVQETDAPRVLLAWLFGTNTVLAVALQVRAARGVDSVSTSLRASRTSAGFFVLSCLIVLVTHDTIGWVTIALVWLGHVTVTGAELFQSAGHWGYMSELSDPERRGEYQGAAQLGHTLGSVWAPAAYTFLAIEWGAEGWLLIAAIVVLATLGMAPAARAAERYLADAQAGRSAETPRV